MKNKTLPGFFLLILSAFTTTSVWAIDIEFTDGTPYTTRHEDIVFNPSTFRFDNAGPVTEFSWDERPALFFSHLHSNVTDFDIHDEYVKINWKYENQDNDWGLNEGFGSFGGSSSFPSDWSFSLPTWDTHKTPGDWVVSVLWTVDGAPNYENDFAFTVNGPTVTPEPATMVLFGLGGAALAANRLKRNKTKRNV